MALLYSIARQRKTSHCALCGFVNTSLVEMVFVSKTNTTNNNFIQNNSTFKHRTYKYCANAPVKFSLFRSADDWNHVEGEDVHEQRTDGRCRANSRSSWSHNFNTSTHTHKKHTRPNLNTNRLRSFSERMKIEENLFTTSSALRSWRYVVVVVFAIQTRCVPVWSWFVNLWLALAACVWHMHAVRQGLPSIFNLSTSVSEVKAYKRCS